MMLGKSVMTESDLLLAILAAVIIGLDVASDRTLVLAETTVGKCQLLR
jgi:hypothetical protein